MNWSTGIAIEVQNQKKEAPESVRSRMIMALLRQQCGAKSVFGFWTNEGSITLDAPDCPLLHGFELQTITGHNVISDVHLGYAALADSCGKQGRVLTGGTDGEEMWVECDRSFQWPTTTRTQYRLMAPFEPTAPPAATSIRNN